MIWLPGTLIVTGILNPVYDPFDALIQRRCQSARAPAGIG
jgi:hypothetical protein